MTRVDGWEMRLAAEIEAVRAKAFAWGRHDCCTWAASVVQAMTGQDFAARWRGTYRSAAGAARAIRKAGCGGMIEAVQSVLGAPLSSPAFAQRGDVVVDEEGLAVGICTGQMAVFLAPVGLIEQPTLSCRMAWRI